MMWDGGYWGHSAWEGWLMFALMLVFVAAVIVAVVFLVRYLTQQHPGASGATAIGPESPKDILKRRYAAGEIDREEYLQKLSDL